MVIKSVKTAWFTSLDTNNKKRLKPEKHYTPEEYPVFDNYPAIEVGRLKDIPCDYRGTMGVPITVLQYNLDDRFKVDGVLYGDFTVIDGEYIKGHTPTLSGKSVYTRVLIKPNTL